MNPSEVPACGIVEDKIREINKEIIIGHADFGVNSLIYKFRLINSENNRQCEVEFRRAFLDDLRDYTGNKDSDYWKHMEKTLTTALIAPIEKYGLIPFNKEKLKELIFEHVKKALERTQHINKFNLLGKPYQEGSLEHFLNVKFTEEERARAGIAFDELRSQGVLIPTYTDLINPEDWVKVRDEKKPSKNDKVMEFIVKKGETFSIGDLEKVEKIPIDAIFLSSTVENLRDCRAEVVKELESKGIKIIYSESPDFAGIPRNNVYDICLQNVLNASHFIIILDRKYGELYQGTRYGKFKDISITHAELKVALENKEKPIFFYVRDYVWHDYKTWKNNPELICETEHKVFSIIKDFEEAKGWIDDFKTSVDLKSMILKRLGIS